MAVLSLNGFEIGGMEADPPRLQIPITRDEFKSRLNASVSEWAVRRNATVRVPPELAVKVRRILGIKAPQPEELGAIDKEIVQKFKEFFGLDLHAIANWDQFTAVTDEAVTDKAVTYADVWMNVSVGCNRHPVRGGRYGSGQLDLNDTSRLLDDWNEWIRAHPRRANSVWAVRGAYVLADTLVQMVVGRMQHRILDWKNPYAQATRAVLKAKGKQVQQTRELNWRRVQYTELQKAITNIVAKRARQPLLYLTHGNLFL